MVIDKNSRKHIALKRVEHLFELAKETISKDPDLAQRYAKLARKIVMHQRVKLPNEYRRLTCRHCKNFILPGVNCRVRVRQQREPHIVITCLNCGKIMRIPLKERKLP
jgi:ribonuclease P protein subunit RPR2